MPSSFLSRKCIVLIPFFSLFEADNMKYILVMVVSIVFYFWYFTLPIYLVFQVNLFKMNTLSISAHTLFISIQRLVKLQITRSVLGKSLQ